MKITQHVTYSAAMHAFQTEKGMSIWKYFLPTSTQLHTSLGPKVRENSHATCHWYDLSCITNRLAASEVLISFSRAEDRCASPSNKLSEPLYTDTCIYALAARHIALYHAQCSVHWPFAYIQTLQSLAWWRMVLEPLFVPLTKRQFKCNLEHGF